MFPNVRSSSSPSKIIITTPRQAIVIEISVPILKRSFRKTHPRKAAINGVILKIKSVEATELLNMANTYIEKAIDRFIPIQKSFQSRVLRQVIGPIFRLKHIKISIIRTIPNDR